MFLAFNLTLTIASVVVVSLLIHVPSTTQAFVIPVLAQIICCGGLYDSDLIRREFPQPWYYRPRNLLHVSHDSVDSLAGLIMWGMVAISWIALPHFRG